MEVSVFVQGQSEVGTGGGSSDSCRFLLVLIEDRGWWLPHGVVSCGETIKDAAERICKDVSHQASSLAILYMLKMHLIVFISFVVASKCNNPTAIIVGWKRLRMHTDSLQMHLT